MDFKDLLKKLTVLPNDEYERKIQADDAVLICVPPSFGDMAFADNIKGKCDGCKTPIGYRPINAKATTKLCVECALKLFGRRRMDA